MGSHNWAKT